MGQLLADNENIINQLSHEHRNITRSRITNIITNYWHKDQKVHSISTTYNKCRQFLKSNPQILILQSDKGNVTVIMSKEQYNDRAVELTSDQQYYQPLASNPTSNIQTKNNKLVKQLKDKKYITDEKAKKLMCHTGISPKFYGQPKYHKDNVPLRPVISNVGSPQKNYQNL